MALTLALGTACSGPLIQPERDDTFSASTAAANTPPAFTPSTPTIEIAPERGLASWYGHRSKRRRRTANGGWFDRNALTAAHRTLPFGTRVQLRNLRNGCTVIVSITDRGPSARSRRLIDVSYGAARALDLVRSGVAAVELEVVIELARN